MNHESNTVCGYEDQYVKYGISAQRLYPNEALCRFLGRNGYLSGGGKGLRILELGSGSGGNLWMLAKEGFETHGVDGSLTSIEVANKHLKEKWGVTAKIKQGRFECLPFENDYFDVVIDIVSLQCLDLAISEKALREVWRVLKNEGKFFSYRLSDHSCMYLNSGGSYIDAVTVDNIADEEMPLRHNNMTTFWSPGLAKMLYHDAGLKIKEIERDTRTYQNGKLSVEYLEIEAEKLKGV